MTFNCAMDFFMLYFLAFLFSRWESERLRTAADGLAGRRGELGVVQSTALFDTANGELATFVA